MCEFTLYAAHRTSMLHSGAAENKLMDLSERQGALP